MLPHQQPHLINSSGDLIPIEERSGDEVAYTWDGQIIKSLYVSELPQESPANNPAFDVTPAELVVALSPKKASSQSSRQPLIGEKMIVPEKKES